MSEIGKEKTYQIFKIAKELNIAAERIIDFLTKEAKIAVKSHASKVDENTYQLVLNKFKKEKQSEETRQKKIEAFKLKKEEPKKEKEEKIKVRERKKLTKTYEKEVEQEQLTIAETIEEVVHPETIASLTVEETKEELVSADEIFSFVDTQNTTQVTDTVTEEILEIGKIEEIAKPDVTELIPEPVAEPVLEEHEVVEQIVELPKDERIKTSLDEIKEKIKGPKVIGKINLEGETAVESIEEIKTEDKKLKKKVIEPEIEESDKKKKKKPKKKQLRELIKKKQVQEEESVKAKKPKKSKIRSFDEKEIESTIRKTLESMDESSVSVRAALRKKKKKEKQEELKRQEELLEKEKSILRVSEFITVNELANLMKVPSSEIIKNLFSYGIRATINQRLEKDTIQIVADNFGYQVEFQDEDVSTIIEDQPDPEEKLKKRPPIVTIMGHVDHGKTSLLDYIRSSQIVAGEAGGITQHIGAYKVELPDGNQITFLDTPGHEAFTAMRARGAKVTDIVVLVVAADDAVMPQTVEAINHAQAAGVPIIVAINKIDKPTANPEKIKQQLLTKNVVIEEYGGKYQSVEISAKTGKNIDLLLEKILIEAEMLDLKANPDRQARGFVIEVKLDKGRGIVATVLILKGTLRVNDPFVAGVAYGRIRAMFDERGNRLNEAPPSTPVQVLGFDEMPQAGDEFVVVESEKFAREIANKRMQIKREQEYRMVRHVTLEDISKGVKLGEVKDLRIVIKGDVDGSVEAISDALSKLSNEEVEVKIIHKAVGAITEADVLLASASNAIIIGFNVRPNLEARKLAEKEQIEIRLYNIIYDIINDVKNAIVGLLSPEIIEEVTATVEVRETFKIAKVGTIAGCYVKDGKIQRNNKVRIVRDGIVVFAGDIESLKRFKDDIREVEANKECGIKIANFNDIKVGDIIEAYRVVEKQRTLESVNKN